MIVSPTKDSSKVAVRVDDKRVLAVVDVLEQAFERLYVNLLPRWMVVAAGCNFDVQEKAVKGWCD